MTREEVVTEARKWLGKPWVHQGRGEGPTSAVDCIGLVQRVGHSMGVHYEDMLGYSRTPDGVLFLKHMRKFLHPADPKGNLVGTVGVFLQARYPLHTGIFSSLNGATHLINARANIRKVVEEPWIPGNGFILVEVLAFPGLEK